MSYFEIFEKLEMKYGTNNFEQIILESFEKAKEKNPENGVNKMFLEILGASHRTIKEIDTMIEYGADIFYKNGKAFGCLCLNTDNNFVLYYLDKYNFDVNNLKKLFFSFEYSRDEKFKIFLDRGLVIDDYILSGLFRSDISSNKLLILLDSGLTIKELIDCFLEKANKNNFYHARNVANHFLRQIIKTNNDSAINGETLSRLLTKSIFNDFSLEEIRTIFAMGADPRYGNDIFLIESCLRPDPELVLVMINEYGCNINERNSYALPTSISHYNYNTAKLLLDMGINITDDALIESFDKIDFLELLAKYHTDLNHFFELFFKKIIKSNTKYLDTFKFLIQNGVDANHVVLNTSLIKN